MNIVKEIGEIVSDTTIWTPKTLKDNTILIHKDSEITDSYYPEEGVIKAYNYEKVEKIIINLL